MKYDVLIVGAGIAGCVIAARYAEETNKKVLIIDRRDHIGGNCYDYYDEAGVLVHKYGPHAFHTNNKKVWEFLNRYTEFNDYNHRVLVAIDGQNVPLPFNFNTIGMLFPETLAERLERKLTEKFEYGKKVPILELRKTDDEDLKFLAEYVYEKVFLGYTVKQWEQSPEEIDPSISGRVPILISRDDRYFTDTFQGIPVPGYTEMFKKMIFRKNIHLMLNTDFADIKGRLGYDTMIYTGAIDEYFDYKHGELPYRSCDFDLKTLPQEYFLEIGQLNFPSNYEYTRITEFKYFTGQQSKNTTIAYEYPRPFIRGKNERFYPVPGDKNAALYDKYRELAKAEPNVYLTGRLGEYRYFNMDQAVLSAMNFDLK